jgi:hypothetical protein
MSASIAISCTFLADPRKMLTRHQDASDRIWNAKVRLEGAAAMAFGVIISLAVGFGLMALIFYSSRKGYDEPPVLVAPEDDSVESKDGTETK